MYTAIWGHTGGVLPNDELARAGRGLANQLAASGGFVVYLLLELSDGNYASVVIFEDQASLAAAQGIVAGSLPISPSGPGQIAGAVLVQKGL